MLVYHFRPWEMVVPRNLKVSMVVTGLLDSVRGSSAEGCLLKSTVVSTVERVQLQVVLTAPAIAILDESMTVVSS